MVHPASHTVIASVSGGGEGGPGQRDSETLEVVARAYVGVWDQDDNGDVAPLWTIARGHIYMPRGLTIDSKHKTVIVSDKFLNAVMTFSLPELFDRRMTPRQTARN